MGFLDRLLGDPERALEPSYTVVPLTDLDSDEPEPDMGDADGMVEAGKKS